MPRLIVLNGPPGCGKSTLAGRYVDQHPLSLNLDIDRIRDLVGCWREHPHAAGLLARAITLAGARTHLTAGHDVIIPQFLGHPDFLEQVEQLADEVHADFREIVLLDSKANALRRFAERRRLGADPARSDATMDEIATMYDRLMSIVATRPRAVTIASIDGQLEQTYQRLLDALAALTT